MTLAEKLAQFYWDFDTYGCWDHYGQNGFNKCVRDMKIALADSQVRNDIANDLMEISIECENVEAYKLREAILCVKGELIQSTC